MISVAFILMFIVAPKGAGTMHCPGMSSGCAGLLGTALLWVGEHTPRASGSLFHRRLV